MSIQTELTRITNAKAAIKTAIEGKGVTVPDATLLDGMAALIESIEAGGGGANAVVVVSTYIPSSTSPYGPYLENYLFADNGGPPTYIFAQYVPDSTVSASANKYVRSMFLERTSFDGTDVTYQRYSAGFKKLESITGAPHVDTITQTNVMLNNFSIGTNAGISWGEAMKYMFIAVWLQEG